MLSLVPAPARLDLGDGPGFRLEAPVRVVVPADDRIDAVAVAHLGDLLGAVTGGPAIVGPADPGPDVRRSGTVELRLTGTGEGGAAPDESYTLTIDADQVVVAAAEPIGLFRGAGTLLQVLDSVRPDADGPVVLPALHVEDAPRYPWRGVMVDVVRHWFDVDVLKGVIDLAATYKLNVLHLHLTDDQGWRLELVSRPLLTERSGTTQVGGGGAGYLSAADYAELVEYAALRRVTLVPEIDTPGHVTAAQHAYGELTPSGEPAEVADGTHVGRSKITLHEPATLPFVRDVFSELAAMTPGRYVHGGGDEAETMDPQDYREFIEVLGEVVAATGKDLVVWQEAGVATLPPGALVQLWASGMATDGVLAAAARGHDVILSPSDHVYLDMKYTPDFPLGLDWSGHTDVRRSYEWDPATLVDGLDPARVRGVEAALWTETVTTRDELFTMLLPRLVAAAEVAWTPQERRASGGFDDFARRLAAQEPLWHREDWAFHRSVEVPWAASDGTVESD
ncbi:beta-N-acetylhexosaminidase [Georgenia subflava]|uniref:beta-N-acetylhexosaminidase n=1 Tax=Georgenia subflava TaxID=1622177 RepID=A0A6N7EKL1_9MICO|nr:family 20 glycosylhydrolase [Georgenia subflava]MPV37347.1 family 20 glycosylhydrolase [Georgenia subflava]